MPESARNRLTVHIIAAMLVGAACGIGINLSQHLPTGSGVYGWLQSYAANGLFAVVGQAFLALLSVLVVPLVLVSLVCGTAALEDVRRLGRIGLRTLGLYLLTTALAISLALAVSLLVKPGAGFGLSAVHSFESRDAPSLVQVLIDIFPRNIFQAMASGNMLQLIVFAILFGLALNLAGDAGQRLLAVFADLNDAILKLVWIVMQLAPFGVFALIARTFANEGLDAMLPLFKYFAVVLGTLIIHCALVYPLLLRLFARLPAWRFLRKLRDVHVFAFSTASSNATIPVTLNALTSRLGVPRPIAAFTVPLGATINMDGTAIMQGVATVFIAQAYGIGLSATDCLVVVLTATLASIGTAGVPGVGLVMLSLVLKQVGLPIEGIALIIGIDRLLDMVRTAVNVTGDAMVSCVVAKAEGELDLEAFRAPAGD
jgi:Na+/H+-dicarboxylate symporter